MPLKDAHGRFVANGDTHTQTVNENIVNDHVDICRPMARNQ